MRGLEKGEVGVNSGCLTCSTLPNNLLSERSFFRGHHP